MCVYIYIYIYLHVYIYTCAYIGLEERLAEALPALGRLLTADGAGVRTEVFYTVI